MAYIGDERKMKLLRTIKGALRSKKYKTSISVLNRTWRQFDRAIKGKKLFLYSAGAAYDDFMKKYGSRYPYECVIDRNEDVNKNIHGKDYLKNYDPKTIVILILSTKYYEEIYEELQSMGLSENVFSFCVMECKRCMLIGKIESAFYEIRTACYKLIRSDRFLLFADNIIKLFPINRKKIVFCRHDGLGFGCHEKYIALELLRRGKNYKLVWLVDDLSEEFPEGIKKVKNTRLRKSYELATSRIWIDDAIRRSWMYKKRGQYYINTSHGVGISLKKFGLEADNTSEIERQRIVYDSGLMDIYLSGSKFISQVYKSAFALKIDPLEVGSPRLDIVLKNDEVVAKRTKEKLNIPEKCKVVLYAPTFRRPQTAESVQDMDFNQLEIDRLQRKLQECFGGEWVILFRFHPMMRWKKSFHKESDRAINVSSYPDMQELICASDIMITDYSSVMFDFAFSGKPVFLYAYDLEEYCAHERGLYFEIEQLPFPVAKDMQQLLEQIENYEEASYHLKWQEFIAPLQICEHGDASRQVAQVIEDMMENKKGYLGRRIKT
jgi:CDP-glycerol glycerophosphotransferase